MLKIAKRSYGRNPDGSRRTAAQLIMDLGGAEHHPSLNAQNTTLRGRAYVNGEPRSIDGIKARFSRNYYNAKIGDSKATPRYFITGNGKYNFSETSPERFEIGREIKDLKNTPQKIINQHTRHENRLLGRAIRGRADENYDHDKDFIEMYSGNHGGVKSVFGDKAKKNVENNKEVLYKLNKAFYEKMHPKKSKTIKDSGNIPYFILGAGLLTGGGAGALELYDKIKKKRQNKEQEKSQSRFSEIKAQEVK